MLRIGSIGSGGWDFLCTHAHRPDGGAAPQIVSAFVEYLRTATHQGATPKNARSAVACLATQSRRNGNQPYDGPVIRAAPRGDPPRRG